MDSLKMILIPESSNVKTGNIIQSYSSRSTCPERCPFKDGKGCYAEGRYTSRVWDRCEDKSDSRYISNEKELKIALTGFLLERVHKDSKAKVLFRHNVAGDIAVKGASMIDESLVKALSDAVAFANSIFTGNLRGYTYTHCEIDKDSAKVIHDAYDKEFLINASCETVSEVKRVKDLGVDAVIASVDPKETLKDLEEEGLKGVLCPAQLAELTQGTEGMTCEKCRLCSRHREAVVIFKVHGRAHKRATKVIMLKQQQNHSK